MLKDSITLLVGQYGMLQELSQQCLQISTSTSFASQAYHWFVGGLALDVAACTFLAVWKLPQAVERRLHWNSKTFPCLLCWQRKTGRYRCCEKQSVQNAGWKAAQICIAVAVPDKNIRAFQSWTTVAAAAENGYRRLQPVLKG